MFTSKPKSAPVIDSEEFEVVRRAPRLTSSPSDHFESKEKVAPHPVVSLKKSIGTARAVSALSGSRSRSMGSASLPPQIDNTLVVRSRIRYVAGADSLVSVSAQDLAGALGGVCTVTNSVFKPWASSFRIRKIVAWPSQSTTLLNAAAISWNSGIAGANRDSERSADIPEGITITEKVDFKPPPKSLASDWFAASVGTTNIFTMTCNEGSILDLHVDFTLSNQFSAGTSTIATGVLGSIYYLPLDGASSHQYFPVHLPTTF
jgi:hypothetical protein